MRRKKSYIGTAQYVLEHDEGKPIKETPGLLLERNPFWKLANARYGTVDLWQKMYQRGQLSCCFTNRFSYGRLCPRSALRNSAMLY